MVEPPYYPSGKSGTEHSSRPTTSVDERLFSEKLEPPKRTNPKDFGNDWAIGRRECEFELVETLKWLLKLKYKTL